MNARYTHVIFDLDGTVYDSNKLNMSALSEVLRNDFKQQVTTEDLLAFCGVSTAETFEKLGIDLSLQEQIRKAWYRCLAGKLNGAVSKFDGMISVLSNLKKSGIKMGIVTSREHVAVKFLGDDGDPFPQELKEFFEVAVCADDVEHGKPAPDMAERCMCLMHADPKRTLYIGDTVQDLECAHAAGADFALAMWGYCGCEHLNPEYFLTTPYEILNAVFSEKNEQEQWLRWAREIQAIGQIGLAYTQNVFDKERFTRLREIACEMVTLKTEVSKETVRNALALDKGYACPKVDTRAAIFNAEGEILMVKEKMSGLWNVPGGWCDEGESAVSNVLKELREEACMNAAPVKLVAVLDRNRHNTPRFAFGVIKIFIECKALSQNFKETDETSEYRYFARDALPVDELRLDTNTKEQLDLCFEAHKSAIWQTVIE